MGAKGRVPWAFDYVGPQRGIGRWGRRMLGRGWVLLEGWAARLRTPAGASVSLLVIATAFFVLLYPIYRLPATRRPAEEPRGLSVVVPPPAGRNAGEPQSSQLPRKPAPKPGTPARTSGSAAPLVAIRPAAVPQPVERVLTQNDFARPVMGRILAQAGWRKNPVYGDWRYHPGVDLALTPGEVVAASQTGEVMEVRTGVPACGTGDGRAGVEVILSHGGGWTSTYLACGTAAVVKGERVEKGVALLRATATPSALHFVLRKNGEECFPAWISL